MSPFRPTRLEIFLTNKCNLRCTYCSSRHLLAGSARTLCLSSLKRAVDIFASYGPGPGPRRTICFTGGEPLLEFGLLKAAILYVRGLREPFDITVNTNATLLDRRKAEFFIRGDVYLAASLDGGRETHDAHRVFASGGGSVYDVLMRNLRALSPASLARVRASVTVTSRTMPSMIGTISLLQDLGFRFVELGLDAYERWTPGGLRMLARTLEAVRRHYSGLLASGDPEKTARVFTFSLENKQQKAGFYTPMGDVSLSPDGLFYPSDTLATAAEGGSRFVVGDLENGIDEAKLRAIYRSAAAAVPPEARAEGAFSPVDRYLYCLAHGRDPRLLLADAAAANAIFSEKIGGLLEVQRAWRELAKDKDFGDLAHAPRQAGARPVRRLALQLRGRAPSGLRTSADYALYSPARSVSLSLRASRLSGAFGSLEASAIYSSLKARALGKRLRLAVEADSL
ncbi:MAG: radical SAM protein [Elusimicrobiales bacterium]|nr:radical SAM protein [Elusimicrobiales bacterium]